MNCGNDRHVLRGAERIRDDPSKRAVANAKADGFVPLKASCRLALCFARSVDDFSAGAIQRKRMLRVAFIGGRGVVSKYSGIETYYEEMGKR
jgi:hypothetical protein